MITDWNQRKQQVYDHVKTNSYKYNGAEIEDTLDISSIKELKIEDGKYISYLGELEREGKIKYDYRAHKWYIQKCLTVKE